MKLTAQTQSGLKATITYRIVCGSSATNLQTRFIAKTEHGETSCSFYRKDPKVRAGRLTGTWCAKIYSAQALWPSMPAKSGLIKIDQQDLVDQFKEEAETARKKEIKQKTVSIKSLSNDENVQITFASGSAGLICNIQTSQEIKPEQKENIEKYLVAAKRKKIIKGILDTDYTYRENLTLSVCEVLDIIASIDNEKVEEEKETAKFEQAKQTGNPVILHKNVLPEAETPLRDDGEGDMVDCVTLAMPDGSKKTKYYHNY